MEKRARKLCPRCGQLERQLAEQAELLKALRAKVLLLEEKLAAAQKNSSTSSKPPSSDIVKPPPAESTGSQRSIGGQPGHPKHEREPFRAEQVTSFAEHPLDACPCCGGELRLSGALPQVVQQVDILPARLTVEQHTCPEYWCGQCQKAFKAPLPLHMEKGGLVGPRLTALIAYMKGVCHASFSTVRKYLRDIVGVTISRGQLSKIVGKVTRALEKPYEELLALLPSVAVAQVDETGHKDNGEPWWTWCFRTELFTLYHIDAYRNADVLMKFLGEDFAGLLGCDYFSAYRRYMRECSIVVQFCLAHLIRDVKFLTKLPDVRDQRYGERLRQAVKDLFAVIHQREQLPLGDFALRLQQARQHVLDAGLNNVPGTRHSQNMAKRFRRHGEAYFTFITHPGVEPTNNLAEQAIRFVVIDRHITQGTRSEGGRRWSERIWTAMATCAQQGSSVYDFLYAAITRWFANEPAPSLLTNNVIT
jgi:transposase